MTYGPLAAGRTDMPSKALRFCKHPGCPTLTRNTYCEAHQADAKEIERAQDERRGTSRERGYTHRWSKYSKWFLSLPENQFCALHLDDGCAGVAQCVDHIQPPSGPGDALFWDRANHQPACIHCNSAKGRRYIVGAHEYGEQSTGGK